MASSLNGSGFRTEVIIADVPSLSCIIFTDLFFFEAPQNGQYNLTVFSHLITTAFARFFLRKLSTDFRVGKIMPNPRAGPSKSAFGLLSQD